MSKLVNRGNLPEALVRAVQNDGYDRGNSDYTTTQLSKPSRIVALEKIHGDEIEEDVSDRIYALMGKLGHAILEHSGTADIIEKRLYTEIDGKILSGQVDVVDGTVLEDYKFCSIYVFKEGVKKEWQAQASVNSYLCAKNGITITEARYIAIYRDFSLPKSKIDPDHPRQQVQVFPVSLWSMEETERWIKERIQSHENALKSLPECTEEERWARNPKWAVMKKGGKRAVKLYDEEIPAERHAASESGLHVEYRPGVSTRCQYYCPCLPFCDFGKRLVHQDSVEF